uniref:ANK_REP_REGION domain-containing protein n=1 Tax=Strongyloides venezuelensis TaxID=75913 RepID=A0A0K0FF56_STRVS
MKFLSFSEYNFLRDCEEGNLSAVQMFIESKLKKKITMNCFLRILIPRSLFKKVDLCKYKYQSNGYNPLHLAILSGNIKLIEYLIDIDKKLVHQKDDKGRSPLHLILSTRNSDIWKEIVCKKNLKIFIEDFQRECI